MPYTSIERLKKAQCVMERLEIFQQEMSILSYKITNATDPKQVVQLEKERTMLINAMS